MRLSSHYHYGANRRLAEDRARHRVRANPLARRLTLALQPVCRDYAGLGARGTLRWGQASRQEARRVRVRRLPLAVLLACVAAALLAAPARGQSAAVQADHYDVDVAVQADGTLTV